MLSKKCIKFQLVSKPESDVNGLENNGKYLRWFAN
jgi:hypothetical protein